MSTILLPKSTLNTLEKLSRSFLWGSTQEKKKQHLMAWSRVCKPKKDGGLGIRSAEAMNKALLAKIGWRVIHDKQSLWARVLHSKYKIGSAQITNWTTVKSNWSSTWRSVGLSLREVVLPGLRWVIGDGNSAKFWSDSWLLDKSIKEALMVEIPEEMLHLTVRELWRNNMGWNWDLIGQFVTPQVKLQLSSMVVDTVTGARDRIAWGASHNGSFSVKSAYSVLTEETSPRTDMGNFFGLIWKVKVPERVRVFLWLVGNQVIMSNSERHRRHLCDSGLCTVCKSGEETTLHILRDCPAISGVWQRVVPTRKQRSFFDQSLLELVYCNLRETTEVDEVPWPIVFGMIVWWGWKWRCGNVFGVNGSCRDRVRFVKELAKEVWLAHKKQGLSSCEEGRVERLIAWKFPSEGWTKLNTDGASHGNPGLATAGGVLRDAEGGWIQGFALNIGYCSAPLAELWGVYYGLFLAWERQITHLELEVDSELVVGFLTKGNCDTHPLSFLVRLCYGFLSKDWSVRVTHVYREANRLADGLANYAFSQPLGFHLLELCPESMGFIVLEDSRGALHPRRVRL